jgi:hypothetical protein
MGLPFTIAPGPRQRSHSRVQVSRDSWHILLTQIRDYPIWRAPGTGWPSYTSRHWVPFWSPPTTRRVTMEVFQPLLQTGYVALCRIA